MKLDVNFFEKFINLYILFFFINKIYKYNSFEIKTVINSINLFQEILLITNGYIYTSIAICKRLSQCRINERWKKSKKKKKANSPLARNNNYVLQISLEFINDVHRIIFI